MSERPVILDFCEFRFACKEFDPEKKIPNDVFRNILEAGRLSPSSFGFEPWKFVIVQDMKIREEIRTVSWGAQTQLPSASHFLLMLARKADGMAPWGEYLQETIMRKVQHMPEELCKARGEKFESFLKDDFEIWDNERARFEWAARQCYLSLANMMIAAASMEIDTSPIEGFHKEKLETLLANKNLLDRENYGIACMLAFGYRVQGPKRPKTRRPLEDIVSWV